MSTLAPDPAVVASLGGIAADDEATFVSTLSKDELPPGYVAAPDTFVKHAVNAYSARAEYLALQALATRAPQPLTPRPRFYGPHVVGMELIRGIRGFECMRLLRALESAGEIPAGRGRRLMERMLSRLEASQPLITSEAGRWTTSVYPFDVKVQQLLELLSSRLNLAAVGAAYAAQLRQMEHEWNDAVGVPFMDRVLKNTIVVDHRLEPGHHDGDTRRRLLRDMVIDEPEWLDDVPIRDVDFASVTHLTTIEDDWVSLQLHEATAWMHPTLDTLVLPSEAERGRRLGLTLVMRYLRFGGRKMAYALMHPAAFAVRFAGHDAGFYFRRLPELVAQADEALLVDYEAVFAHIAALSTAFDALPPRIPHADPWAGQRQLWRESPLEGVGFVGLVSGQEPIPESRGSE